MPDPRRTPWIAVDVDIRKDDRVADLPSDAARWGYVAGVLAEARLQSPRGVFGSRATFEEAVGRFSRYLEQYIAVGLLERAPKLCPRCAEAFPDVRANALIVHNWARKQRDPGAAERAKQWREEHTDERSTNGVRTRDERPTNAGRTVYSRARAETQTQTLDTKENLGSSGVTPRAGPSVRTSYFDIEPTEPEYPVAQLLAKRYRYRTVTESQWERLHEIVDNEYPVGTSKGSDRHAAWRWLAELMANLGRDDGDPISAALGEVNRRIAERLGQQRQAAS